MLTTLISKIKDSKFNEYPYKHLFIEDFIEPKYFKDIVRTNEIRLKRFEYTRDLFSTMIEKGWEPIQFPGTTTIIEDYIMWERGLRIHTNVDTCEGFGMVLRLQKPKSQLLTDIQNFLSSDIFIEVLCEKFRLDCSNVYADTGIQKYLNGYEISPHPDVRSKALTFMVNINDCEESDSLDFHTKYMVFKNKYKYVQEFWKYNSDYDRCWVPWSWCQTVFEQRVNNSIVVFSPSDSTLHAVKASYDHLVTQRTQLYGNLWYNNMPSTGYIKRNQTSEPLKQLPWQAYLIDESKGTSMVYKTDVSAGSKDTSQNQTKIRAIKEIIKSYWNL